MSPLVFTGLRPGTEINKMNLFSLILTQPLTNGLIFFYQFLGQNMGLAILGFGGLLWFISSQLTKPQMESMKKMKLYEGELARLKERHKDDKQKLMMAQTDFYKEKGINPAAGCLPMVLQLILLIAFFNVFTRVLRTSGDAAKLNDTLYTPLRFEAGEKINSRFLYLDLTKPDAFKLSWFPTRMPGPVLILAAIFQFLSAKIAAPYVALEKKAAQKTPGSADDMQVAMQSSMVYTFPLMTIVFGLNFPSALALYWLMFSFLQVLRQYRASGRGGLTPLIENLGYGQKINR